MLCIVLHEIDELPCLSEVISREGYVQHQTSFVYIRLGLEGEMKFPQSLMLSIPEGMSIWKV